MAENWGIRLKECIEQQLSRYIFTFSSSEMEARAHVTSAKEKQSSCAVGKGSSIFNAVLAETQHMKDETRPSLFDFKRP